MSSVGTKFYVGLAVTSRKLSLSELAERLGRQPRPGSHDKGAPRGLRGDTWAQSVWRENARDVNAVWCDQALQLLRDAPPGLGALRAAEPDEVSISLDVAVFFCQSFPAINRWAIIKCPFGANFP